MIKRSTLESVYRTYMPDVYRYLRSLCGDDAAAEDLVQETFYRAYLHLEKSRCPILKFCCFWARQQLRKTREREEQDERRL